MTNVPHSYTAKELADALDGLTSKNHVNGSILRLAANKLRELSSGPNYELLYASRDVVKWLDSEEVKNTFQVAAQISHTHPHLMEKVPTEFAVWASVVLKRFREAVNGTTATRSEA